MRYSAAPEPELVSVSDADTSMCMVVRSAMTSPTADKR